MAFSIKLSGYAQGQGTITAAYNQAAGHTILAIAQDVNATLSGTIYDTAGNAWTPVFGGGDWISGSVGAENYLHVQAWYCINCLGNAANIVCVSGLVGDSGYGALRTYDITGNITGLDVAATPPDHTVSSLSSTFSTNYANEVIVSMVANSYASLTAMTPPVVSPVAYVKDLCGNLGAGGPYSCAACRVADGTESSVTETWTATPATSGGNNYVFIFSLYNTDSAYAQISGAALAAGATVSYTGPSSGSVVSAGDGSYLITGVTAGTYTITPSAAGITFSPSSKTVSPTAGAAVTADFAIVGPYCAQSSVIPNGGGPAVAAAFAYPNKAGSLLVMAVHFCQDFGAATIADTAGNTNWTIMQESVNGQRLVIAYCYNCKAGANTVTMTFPNSNQYGSYSGLYEFGGFGAADPLDKSYLGTIVASGTTPEYSAPLTPSASCTDLAFVAACNTTDGMVPTIDSGFQATSPSNWGGFTCGFLGGVSAALSVEMTQNALYGTQPFGFLLFSPAASFAVPVVIQTTGQAVFGVIASAYQAFTSPQFWAGNALFCTAFSYPVPGTPAPSVTDNAGSCGGAHNNTWVLVKSYTDTDNNAILYLYKCSSCVSTTSPITVTFSDATTDGIILSISEVANVNTLDQFISGDSAGASPWTSPTLTTQQPNTFVIGAMRTGSTAYPVVYAPTLAAGNGTAANRYGIAAYLPPANTKVAGGYHLQLSAEPETDVGYLIASFYSSVPSTGVPNSLMLMGCGT